MTESLVFPGSSGGGASIPGFPGWIPDVGHWLCSSQIDAGSTTGTLSTGQAWYVPISIPVPCKLDRITHGSDTNSASVSTKVALFLEEAGRPVAPAFVTAEKTFGSGFPDFVWQHHTIDVTIEEPGWIFAGIRTNNGVWTMTKMTAPSPFFVGWGVYLSLV
jgi:hypothetical protein